MKNTPAQQNVKVRSNKRHTPCRLEHCRFCKSVFVWNEIINFRVFQAELQIQP